MFYICYIGNKLRRAIAKKMCSGIATTGTKYSLKTFGKVPVIGLGQLGLSVAKYVKDRGFAVYGYDISTKALERVEYN